MSLAANKALLLLAFSMFTSFSQAKQISILIIGQSISANCNEYIFGERDGIYQYDKEGKIIKARDPFIWADCKGGSMWMPLGDKIIKSHIASSVIFMPIGVGGTKVSDWLEGGETYKKLELALNLIRKKHIKFDYIFWHQGTSDIGTDPALYKKNFLRLTKIVKQAIPDNTPWLIARHSMCSGNFDQKIEAIQTDIAIGSPFFHEGPNNNILDEKYRFDNCHLNKLGQEKMADMWLESLKNSIKKRTSIERETLIHLFRYIQH
ncbi:hypothetical protein HQ400_14300 [Aeromonas jandaei]|nr:hypothetical protein HQ400_14300 [Aeromonas jandaei]